MTKSEDGDEESKSPWWVVVINRLGLPTALLCVLLFMLWRGGVWIADNVFVPIVAKQIAYIESASQVGQDVVEMTAQIRDSVKQQQIDGAIVASELKMLSAGVLSNSVNIKSNQDMLKATVENDEKSLKALQSIDQTLKNQQEVLGAIQKK